MEVVAHQAVGVCLHSEPVVDVSQAGAEFDPIDIVEEHDRVIDATIHHVVPAILGITSRRTGHSSVTVGSDIAIGVCAIGV
jgi:hypothetical protein